MNRRLIRWGSVILIAGVAGMPEQAVASSAHENEIARCIRRSAMGRKWLEITLWGLRDQEGGWAGAVVPNKNGSTDLGPLQINSWWVPRLAALTGSREINVRRWLADDVCFNVDAARWIFLTALTSTRDYWSAVGAYNSPNPRRARRYTLMFAAKLERRFGKWVFDRRAHEHGRVFREGGKINSGHDNRCLASVERSRAPVPWNDHVQARAIGC